MMTSILRLRLVEAANYLANNYPDFTMTIEPMFIRIKGGRGFFSIERLVDWDSAENSEHNVIIARIDQAVAQLNRRKGRDYDTSMGL